MAHWLAQDVTRGPNIPVEGKMMKRHFRILLPHAVLAAILITWGIEINFTCARPATNQGKAAPSTGWTINYSVSGGMTGRFEHLVLRDDGEAMVEGGRRLRTTFKISTEQLARIQASVARIDLAAARPPAKPPNHPDMQSISLTITRGGREIPIGQQGQDLMAALQPIVAQGLKRAEDEMWAKAGPFRLGRIWKVQEEVRDDQGMWHGEEWDGTWTRRADTHTFDAVWRNNRSNLEVRDTVILDSAERGIVHLHRGAGLLRYEGSYDPDHPEGLVGFITPSHGCSWRASIQY